MKILSAVLLALSLSASAEAAGRDDARRAVQAVPDAAIQADLEAALKENDLAGLSTEKEFEYTICPVKLKAECFRFVQFSVSRPGGHDLQARAMVLGYNTRLEGRKVNLDKLMSRVSDGRPQLDRGNIETFRLALAQLEQDYAGGSPYKGSPAVHPLQVTLLQVGAQGERSGMNSNDDHWDTSTNTLVSFSESVESRVVYFQVNFSYLVRTVNDGDKIRKSDVGRLKLDPLLPPGKTRPPQ